MIKHWWKILAVLILLYTFTVGLLVPLGPGITAIAPQSITTGKVVQLKIEGYNSHYASATEKNAWLKVGKNLTLPATKIEASSEQNMLLTFDIPAHFPGEKKVASASLILDNEIDGSSVKPSAVFLTQETLAPEGAALAWSTATLTGLHDKSGMNFPFRNILAETIRNTYFHVPLWFGMMILFLVSVIYSIRYLLYLQPKDDWKAVAFTRVGVLYGMLGLLTGALWAKWTWGAYWSWDIKQNMSAIAMLIYLAYFVLRGSLDDMEKQAKIGAVFNIFAFAALIPLLFVIPRLTSSLHPGNGGNPGLGSEDLDNTMRMVFYPAIIGWTLLGVWMSNLLHRMDRIREYLFDKM